MGAHAGEDAFSEHGIKVQNGCKGKTENGHQRPRMSPRIPVNSKTSRMGKPLGAQVANRVGRAGRRLTAIRPRLVKLGQQRQEIENIRTALICIPHPPSSPWEGHRCFPVP